MFKLSLAISATLSAAQLATYCAKLATQCPGHGITAAACEQGMATIAPGNPSDMNMNTIGCREKFLNVSAYNQTEYCRYAGPTGGGLCGSVLESTCQVATTVCAGTTDVPSYANASECMTGLASKALFWGSRYGASSNPTDTLECRVYHALASVADPTGMHCTHFGETGPCNTANLIPPDVAHYCATLEVGCTGAAAQFGSAQQCWAVASNYNNSIADARPSAHNSLGCRQYHAQAAVVTGSKDHCGHAGPTGGGQCGGVNGELHSWGSMLAASPCMDDSVNSVIATVSPTLLNAAFPTGYAMANGTTSSYSYNAAPGANTQACRIYHLSVATGAPVHCAHGNLQGGTGGECGALASNLCTAIKAVCDFGTNASWQFPSEAACQTELAAANISLGTSKPQSVDGNSYACRFYHVGVAASYAAGGSKATEAGAEANKRTHCSHVLKAPLAGCAGPVVPGGSKAPTPASTTGKNSASTFSLAVSSVAVVLSIFVL